MTLKVKQGGVFTAVGGSGSGAFVDDWTRPSDWVALPTVNSGEQKVVGSVAIYPSDNSNFVGVQCVGAYTVDWGDGTAPVNFASNALAIKNIAYSTVGSGTLTSGGYRQAVITITPQAGSNLTSVTLNPALTSVAVNSGAATPWLDIRMAGASVSTLTVSNTTRPARLLQQFEYVGSSALTTVPALSHSTALRSVVGTAWTSGITSFNSMFVNCSSLRTVPLLNTAAGTSFANMFQNCASLKTIPLLNTAAGLSVSSMFSGCSSLDTLPALNTAAVTNFSFMFASCPTMTTAPTLNTASGTNFQGMFSLCTTLKTVPLYSTTAGITFSAMFNACLALETVPLLNTASGTTFANMFDGCLSLTTVPLLNTANGLNLSFMFLNCSALQTIPLISAAASTNNNNIFANCFALSTGAMAGTKVSISYANCKLSDSKLNAIYTNLASGVVGQTITVTGNHGVAGDTPSIATGKGWTVTG